MSLLHVLVMVFVITSNHLVTCGQRKIFLPIDMYLFFVDSNMAKRSYECTEQENTCLSDDKVLYKPDNKCYSVGTRGPCKVGETYFVDKDEAKRFHGHLLGTCRKRCVQPNDRPMAFVNQCITKREAEEEFCQRSSGMRASVDAFGSWVCEWLHPLCPVEPPPRSVVTGLIEALYYHRCRAPRILAVTYPFENNGSRQSTLKQPVAERRRRPSSDEVPWVLFLERPRSPLPPPVKCTKQEAACLRHGRLFLPADGRCYVLGQVSTALDCQWPVYAVSAFTSVSGRLTGACQPTCSDWNWNAAPLALQGNGACLAHEVVEEKVCRAAWGMVPTKNVFGKWECSCSTPWPDEVVAEKPKEPASRNTTSGLCTVPDFSKPTLVPEADTTLERVFYVRCSESEYACLRRGLVPFRGCHALLSQGMCPAQEQIVLDRRTVIEGKLIALCAKRPCPVGEVALPGTGECLTHNQVETILCPGMSVILDEFGGWSCHYMRKRRTIFDRLTRAEGYCKFSK